MNLRQNFRVASASAPAGSRLAVFHHAGGSSLSFARIAKELGAEAEVWLAEMPAHGTRNREEPANSIADFAHACAQELMHSPDKPLVLYGHSMGALVAYETARALTLAGSPPRLWIISSCHAPHAQHGPRDLYMENLDTDSAVIEIQKAYGNFGPEMDSPALRQYLLPVLRADLRLIAAYRASEGPVPSPLTVLGGSTDPVVLPSDLREWETYTENDFAERIFTGGHFFPFQEVGALAGYYRYLREALRVI
jgi:surfactin synthase thioesterase subunit